MAQAGYVNVCSYSSVLSAAVVDLPCPRGAKGLNLSFKPKFICARAWENESMRVACGAWGWRRGDLQSDS